MQIGNPRNYWVHFCKGALDSAKYLAQFGTGRKFVRYVEQFAENPMASPGLPMMMAEEIHGFGFPLACNFLKDIGFSQYGKPDVHINAILKGLGLSDGRDYQSFKILVQIAEHTGQSVYAVDKALWLIGSGRFDGSQETFKTDRDEFVKSVLPLLGTTHSVALRRIFKVR